MVNSVGFGQFWIGPQKGRLGIWAKIRELGHYYFYHPFGVVQRSFGLPRFLGWPRLRRLGPKEGRGII